MSRAVLITGGARGIGRAAASRFVAAGDRVAIVARPSAALDATAEALGVTALAADLADPAACEAVAARAAEALGPIDVLVNNAGVIHRQPVVEQPLAAWEDTFAVNLRAPFLLARAVLPAMLERGSGRIVNVASISGTLGTPRAVAYCASKWALIGFTKALSEEVKGRGVVVTALNPGSVDTRMLEGSGFQPDMTPEDVADAIHYLSVAPPAIAGAALDFFG
ncbi:MAG: SDR family oxidoreductase [Myxococcales bacterium]|nr:SDR family oxidoreductase [Myxococcales bacterium]